MIMLNYQRVVPLVHHSVHMCSPLVSTNPAAVFFGPDFAPPPGAAHVDRSAERNLGGVEYRSFHGIDGP